MFFLAVRVSIVLPSFGRVLIELSEPEEACPPTRPPMEGKEANTPSHTDTLLQT